MLIPGGLVIDHQLYIINVFCIYDVILHPIITDDHLYTHTLIPMWPVPSPIERILLAIKKEISQTIENRFPFIVFPPLGTVGMAADNTIGNR